jgi:hypothetical protein
VTLAQARAVCAAFAAQCDARRQTLPNRPHELRRSIHSLLVGAAHADRLDSPMERIWKLLNINETRLPSGVLATVLCGPSIDKGQPSDEFIVLRGGKLLSFTIGVHYPENSAADLHFYRYHVRWIATNQFLRFDLNTPGAVHDPLVEPRSHLHAVDPNLRLSLPIMTPSEVLGKLLYGLPV